MKYYKRSYRHTVILGEQPLSLPLFQLTYGQDVVLPVAIAVRLARDLVWKTMLPVGPKGPMFGKWSPNWEGPFQITLVIPRRTYKLIKADGEELEKASMGNS